MIYGMIIFCGRRKEAVRLPSLHLSPFFHSTLVPWWILSLYQSTVYRLIFIYSSFYLLNFIFLQFYLVNLRNSSLSRKPLLSVSIALKAAAALSIFTFFLCNLISRPAWVDMAPHLGVFFGSWPLIFFQLNQHSQILRRQYCLCLFFPFHFGGKFWPKKG